MVKDKKDNGLGLKGIRHMGVVATVKHNTNLDRQQTDLATPYYEI